MKNRIVSLLLAVMMVFAIVSCSMAAEEAKDFNGAELTVATWGWTEAGLTVLTKEFCEKYNCKIVIDPTAGNGPRVNKLIAEKDNPTADVAFLSTSFVPNCIAEGLFDKLDPEVVTSGDGVYPFLQGSEGYAPCYSLVRYGIMYDADQLAAKGLEPPKSYVELYDDKYAGCCIMPQMGVTSGPYMLVAMAEALGGSQENVQPALDLMVEKKDNIELYYETTADVVNAFSTGEACITVFMDINMVQLTEAGYNMVWVDAEEGSFAAPSMVNVVHGCKNPELAQLFVEYMLSLETQNRLAEVMQEAPTNMNATMPDNCKTYLCSGEAAFNALKQFDEDYLNAQKNEWIDYFNRNIIG